MVKYSVQYGERILHLFGMLLDIADLLLVERRVGSRGSNSQLCQQPGRYPRELIRQHD